VSNSLVPRGVALTFRYTGKDQVRPLNAVKKQRNCHIKFAAYDDQVLILGNGNQGESLFFFSHPVQKLINRLPKLVPFTRSKRHDRLQTIGSGNDGYPNV
jgi:hypothetical protein